jgi:hypothetical protein
MFPLRASNEPPGDIYPEQARNLEFSTSLSKSGSAMSRPKFLAKLSQLLQTMPCAWLPEAAGRFLHVVLLAICRSNIQREPSYEYRIPCGRHSELRCSNVLPVTVDAVQHIFQESELFPKAVWTFLCTPISSWTYQSKWDYPRNRADYIYRFLSYPYPLCRS